MDLADELANEISDTNLANDCNKGFTYNKKIKIYKQYGMYCILYTRNENTSVFQNPFGEVRVRLK